MPSRKLRLSDKASLPFKTTNKGRRQDLFIKQKKARGALERAEKFSRKKAESKDPKLREERLRRNVPATLERKRVYDEINDEPEDGGLGVAYDVERLKRRKLAEEQDLGEEVPNGDQEAELDSEDTDSMLDEDSSAEGDDDEAPPEPTLEANGIPDPLPSKAQLQSSKSKPGPRATSPTRSTTSTNLSLAPAALAAKYPTLFPSLSSDTTTPPPPPKILITTSINSTLHNHATTLTSLFPNSTYIRRTSHRYGHKFSIREIASFATNHAYTSLLILTEDAKNPSGLTIVHLPKGPTFHFTVTNWFDASQIPNHGRATSHTPELILNNFSTPLGLLTAHLLRSLFPPSPDLEGRQVLTFHNQRDFIFLRRYRYVLREKRSSEKVVVGSDGTPMKGTEDVRAGLQEVGPRMTLKLRRVDTGVGRGSGQDWEWKGKTDRVRTKFQL